MYGQLYGVTVDGKDAVISISNVNQLPESPDLFWELIEVELETGRTLTRTKKTFGTADASRREEFGLTWPLIDDEQDVARLMGIAHRTRTTTGSWGAPVVVSPDGMIGLHHRYGDDRHAGDWLIVRDRNGKKLGRFNEGFVATYSPTFSPDGTQVAYTACRSQRGKGCEYGTYVGPVDGKRKAIEGLGHTALLEWSADGAYLYGVDTTGRQPFAARYRLGDRAAEEIQGEPLQSLSLVKSPSDRWLVVSGYFGEPGDQTTQSTWYALPELEQKARYELRLGTSLEAVRDDGVALLSDQRGLVAVDPFGEREGRVEGLYQGARASRFDEQGRIIMAHHDVRRDRSPSFELVRINPDVMLIEHLYSGPP